MDDLKTPSQPQTLALSQTCYLLSDPTRWSLLRELGQGEALPVQELARRVGQSPAATSRHLGIMRRLGLVTTGYGRLYALAPAYQPADGANTIDFGHFVARLNGPPA